MSENKNKNHSGPSEGTHDIPPPPERFFEHQLTIYLESAPDDQKNALRNTEMRRRVVKKLEELTELTPLLERTTEVLTAEANRLGVKESLAFQNAVLDDRIQSYCEIEALEARNRALRASNDLLGTKNGELSELARIDPLTGIMNRRAYDEQARRSVDLARRNNLLLWNIMMDIDNFTDINNEYGHQAGDQVLKEIAKRLSKNTRASDVIARYGGEEFMALVHARNGAMDIATGQGVHTVARRLHSAISQIPFTVKTRNGPRVLKVTMSLGGTRFRVEEKESRQDVEDRADEYMYIAKGAGRNQICIEGKVEEKDKKKPAVPKEVQDARAKLLAVVGGESILENS